MQPGEIMAQQTMRGIRLGKHSLESEIGVNYSPRNKHSFQCSNSHISELVFAQDAELPNTWQCKSCPEQAVLLTDGKLTKLDLNELKIPKSHWEMLLERRSKEDLEEILQERISYIRARRKAGKVDV